MLLQIVSGLRMGDFFAKTLQEVPRDQFWECSGGASPPLCERTCRVLFVGISGANLFPFCLSKTPLFCEVMGAPHHVVRSFNQMKCTGRLHPPTLPHLSCCDGYFSLALQYDLGDCKAVRLPLISEYKDVTADTGIRVECGIWGVGGCYCGYCEYDGHFGGYGYTNSGIYLFGGSGRASVTAEVPQRAVAFVRVVAFFARQNLAHPKFEKRSQKPLFSNLGWAREIDDCHTIVA